MSNLYSARLHDPLLYGGFRYTVNGSGAIEIGGSSNDLATVVVNALTYELDYTGGVNCIDFSSLAGMGIRVVFDQARFDVTGYALSASNTTGTDMDFGFRNVQNLVGTNQGDLIDLTDPLGFAADQIADNVLYGYGGNDTIKAGGGDDQINGGLGSNTINGGAGLDLITYAWYSNTSGLIDGRYRTRFSASIDHVTFTMQDAQGTLADTLSEVEEIEATPHADHINLRNYLGATLIDGADGDDVIEIGANNGLTAIGGNGNDVIVTNRSNATILGGSGIDTIDYRWMSAEPGDRVDGRYGIVFTQSLDLWSTAQKSGGFADQLKQDVENWNGTVYDDRIVLNNLLTAANVLKGDWGDDELRSGGGNDTLNGGRGANVLDGGPGIDIVDYSWFTVPSRFLLENRFAISLTANEIGNGAAASAGALFNDTLVSIENVRGSDGDDRIRFAADGRANRFEGGAGNDLLAAGRGRNLVNGGSGEDEIDYSWVNVDLGEALIDGLYAVKVIVPAAGDIKAARIGEIDTLVSIEHWTGSAYADRSKLDDADLTANRLTLGGGNDNAMGGAGADTLLGGDGDDVLAGGLDGDRLAGDAGNDALSGGDGADTLAGGLGRNVLSGGVGTDAVDYSWISVGAGETLLDGLYALKITGTASGDQKVARAGGQVDTLLSIEDWVGSAYADRIKLSEDDATANRLLLGTGNDNVAGGGGNDTLSGGSGSDTLAGGLGNDQLFGDNGNDVLMGGVGADTLYGSAGADTLTGNGAADVFVFNRADLQGAGAATWNDTITDFNPAVDRIDIRALTGGTYELTHSYNASTNAMQCAVVLHEDIDRVARFKLTGVSTFDASFFMV